MLLQNLRLYSQADKPKITIEIEGSLIKALDISEESAEDPDVIDCGNLIVAPGLFDLQTYGAGGIIFEKDVSVSALKKIAEIHLKRGTTEFLITLPTTSIDTI